MCINFQAISAELDTLEPRVTALLGMGKDLMEKSPEAASRTLQQNLHNLETRWENTQARAKDRKVRAESLLMFHWSNLS